MRFEIAAVAAFVAGAAAQYGNGTVAYTTYCPEATTLVHGSQTYTVTEATTLTITDCPCTIVKPITTSAVVYCNTCAAPAVPTTPAAVPITTAYKNTTVLAGTAAKTTTASPAFTGAANALTASGAGLVGLLGLAAYIL